MREIWKTLKDVEERDNYTFIRANICDKEAIEKIFAENDIDRVVHFAAESHVDRSIKNPEIFVQTNVLGTAVMLNCAKAAWEKPDGTFQEDKKFLHVSTDEVYGSLENEGEYFYETTPYAPHSPYSASKAGSDMLVKAYMDTYHFPANITNCSNNYGPYQFPEKLIPLIINNALHGKKASGLRRRQKRARLAVCGGSREGHRHGAGEGTAVRNLQCGRTQ